MAHPNELNDSLDDIFGAPQGEVRTAVHAPVDYVPGAAPLVSNKFKEARQWTEPCRKCRGSGRYNAPSTHGSRCFECDGVGSKTFRTSPEQRTKAKASSQARKAKRAAEILSANAVAAQAFREANPDVSAWIIAKANTFGFAASMQSALTQWGSLTAGQIDAVRRCIAKDAERKVEAVARAEAAPVADNAGVDRLKAAFDHAIEKARAKGRGLKMPRITIGGMTISPAKATSNNPGALYVKSHGQYLGKVKNGRFFSVRECTEDQSKRVLAFIADPKAAAIAYGMETGVCCICNAQLTNKASIEAGIGPICGSNMGW
jgi:Family of unknown function (DUF6011)